MHGLELLKKGAIWRVGRGSNIKIWRHAWIPRGLSLMPARKRRPCRLKWVSSLIDEESKSWKVDVLERYFYQHDVEVIKTVKIPWRPSEDFVAWHFEKSGCFTVRSAYKLGVNSKDVDSDLRSSSRHPDGSRPVWKKFWSLPIPHKVRIFAWKLIHGGLATNSNKHRRRLEPDAKCSICGSEEETGYHAVMQCDHAKALRGAMRTCWPLPEERHLRLTGPEWLLNVIDLAEADAAGQLILILWRSWFVRNSWVHEGRWINGSASINFLTSYWDNLVAIWRGVVDEKGKCPVGDIRVRSIAKLPNADE